MSENREDSGFVLIEERGAVRLVTLNRPEKRNALSIPFRRELATTLARLGQDPGVGVVVLTGAGPHFCSGMDTSQFGGDDENRRALLESTVGLFDALQSLPRPVIGAINGAAIAGGLALAAGCDIRIAGRDAAFSMPEVKMGFGASWATLRRGLPDQVARLLAFTGESFDAEQALSWGFVLEVADDPVKRALEIAESMAVNSVRGLADTKRLMLDGEDADLRRAYQAELRLFASSLFRKREP